MEKPNNGQQEYDSNCDDVNPLKKFITEPDLHIKLALQNRVVERGTFLGGMCIISCCVLQVFCGY